MPSADPTDCLDEQQALDLVDGQLPSEQRRRWHKHLAACSPCAALVADLARVLDGETATGASTFASPRSATRPDELTAPLPSGTWVGPYRVLYPLAAGGMGVVYVGQDPRLDRRVALKLLRADRLEPRAGERLRREARALARLSSPHVVTVHAVGDSAYGVWVAMELVEGQTLDTWMREGPRPWTLVLRKLCAAAMGLADAHAVGIVHRDFKPSNVLLGDDGRVLVADFGLAAVYESGSTLGAIDVVSTAEFGPMTQTGGLVGTPAYMAPEQLRGARADTRSDQFSWCVSAFEAMFGERPYAGRSILGLLESIERGRVRPTTGPAAVPRWIQRVLRRGLESSPARRHADMNALLTALDPKRRRRRTAVAVAGAVLLPLSTVAWASQRPAPSPCDGTTGQAESVWNDEQRTRLGDAFDRLHPPQASAVLATAVRHLDERTTNWSTAYARACDANRSGATADPRVDQRIQCLQMTLDDTETAVQSLLTADAQGLGRANTVVRGLMQVEDCDDPRVLDRRLRLPADPNASEAVQQLRRDLARTRTELAVNQDIDEARERFLALHARATSLNATDQVLTLATEIGRLLHIQGESAEAIEWLEPNYFAAQAANNQHEAGRAATELVQAYGHGLGQLDPAMRWSQHAHAAALASHDPAETAIALLVRGELLDTYDQDEQAERVLLAADAVLPADAPRRTRASVAETLGNLYTSQWKPQRALEWFDQALDIHRRRVGDDHHDLLRSLNGRAVALMQLERLDDALATFEHMNSILDSGGSYTESVAAQLLTNIAALHEMRGDQDLALETYERSYARLTAIHGATHDEPLATLYGIANLRRKRGEHALAVQTARGAIDQALSRDPPRARIAVKTLWVVAESSAALGNYDTAIAAWRERLSLRREYIPQDTEAIAQDEQDLAALVQSHGDTPDPGL